MNYLKFYNGGNVIKRFQAGGQFTSMTPLEQATLMEWANKLGINTGGNPLTDDQIASVTSNARFQAFNPNFGNSSNSFNTTPATLTDEDVTRMRSQELTTLDPLADMKAPGKIIADTSTLRLDSTGKPVGHINVGEEGAGTVATTGTNTPLTGSELPTSTRPQVNKTFANYATAAAGTIAGLVGGQPAADSVNMVSQVAQNPEMAGTSAGKATMGLGVISAAGNMVDKAVMGDKNFGAQSAAIDGAVHTTSSALMQSGNPYAILAGAALETGNFLTKAGGQTVQGFDVDIKSSGYGNMGHKESSSSRDFGAILGLGGLNAVATQRKLKQRNEEAQMALKASNVADTVKFEQEARMNSVDDVIQQNEIALQGGIDTSLLAAKHGARLERIQKQRKRVNPDPEEVIVHENVIIETPEEVIIDAPVVKAQNGAKLEHIEVSEEQNVIPSGAMHKNKNHIDLEITEKGIPVITVEDDSVETFEEIKEQEDTLVQHAEVEEAEIIFNKELTIFVENLRKQWHEKDNKDDSICLEAGMRLAKEIIENTEDNTDVTEKSMEAVDNEEN